MKQQKNDFLLIGVITLCFIFLAFGYRYTEDATTRGLILGAVITTLNTCITWRWGSSKSSSNKDETIRSLQQDIAKPTVNADTVNAENVENLTTTTTNVG